MRRVARVISLLIAGLVVLLLGYAAILWLLYGTVDWSDAAAPLGIVLGGMLLARFWRM